MATVLLVNRTRVNAEALASAFGDEDLQLSLVTVGASDARAMAREVVPDVALMEVDVAVGVRLVRDLRRDHPTLNVIVYGSSDDQRELAAWAETGAARIIMRTIPLTDLVGSVREALRLGAPTNDARTLVHRANGVTRFICDQSVSRPDLTEREQEVLRLISAGFSNRQVAETLSLEVSTVKNHVQHLMRKLGVHRRGDAARYWLAGSFDNGALVMEPGVESGNQRGTRFAEVWR